MIRVLVESVSNVCCCVDVHYSTGTYLPEQEEEEEEEEEEVSPS